MFKSILSSSRSSVLPLYTSRTNFFRTFVNTVNASRSIVNTSNIAPILNTSTRHQQIFYTSPATVIHGGISLRSCYYSTSAKGSAPDSKDPKESTDETPKNQLKLDKPSYQLTFTCKKCDTRSSHNVSKQAYHNGTVLIQCPGCKNRHLIADHLKIFSDTRVTLEDILRKEGQTVTRGTISARELLNNGAQGDLEWSSSDEIPSLSAPVEETPSTKPTKEED